MYVWLFEWECVLMCAIYIKEKLQRGSANDWKNADDSLIAREK